MALQRSVTVNMNMVPFLLEHRFDIWKEKFEMYLYSVDERMPDCLTHGPLVPMMVNTRRRTPEEADSDDEGGANDEMVPKPRDQWTDDDKFLNSLNAKVCYVIGVACDDTTYQHIKGSKDAKVMWQRLLVYIEGDQKAKDNKLFNAQRAFDTFKKEPKESLRECYNRYVEVINCCSSLGKDHSNKDLNMRFLLALGNLWHVKVTTIKDTRDLSTLDLASLYGDLRAYEDTLLLCQQEDKNFNGLSLALAAQREPEPTAASEPVASTSSSNLSAEIEDLMALFAKKYGFAKMDKYKKFYKDNKQKNKASFGMNSKPTAAHNYTPRKPTVGKTPSGDLVCYNCRKPGHFMSTCPQPKFEYYRKRPTAAPRRQQGLIAEEVERPTADWADTDDELETEDFKEETNYCLMAIADDVLVPLCQQAGYTPIPTSSANLPPSQKPSAVTKPKAPKKERFIKEYGGSYYGSCVDPVEPIALPAKMFDSPIRPKAVSLAKRDDSKLNEYSPEELVSVLQEIYTDFENLRIMHTTVSKDLHQTKMAKIDLELEVEGLKEQLTVLPILREEKRVLKETGQVLKEENSRLSAENRELRVSIDTFTKSKAAVETIISQQCQGLETTGLGWVRKEPAFDICGDSDHEDSPRRPKSRPSTSKAKFVTIPHTYPKPAAQLITHKKPSGRVNQGFEKPTAVVPKPQAKTAIAQPPNKPPTRFQPKQTKARKVTFVRAAQPTAPKPKPTSPSADNNNSSCFVSCSLCSGLGHNVYECLLRFTPKSKGRNSSKTTMMWVPKRN